MSIKKKLGIIISVLVIIGAGYYYYYIIEGKAFAAVIKDCKNLDLDAVKKQAKSIEDNISSYKKTSTDIVNGEQTNYSKYGKYVLVKQTLLGQTGNSEVSYYLNNGRVFYMIKKNNDYTPKSLYFSDSKEPKSTDVREYYLDNHLELCSWYQDGSLQENKNVYWRDFMLIHKSLEWLYYM